MFPEYYISCHTKNAASAGEAMQILQKKLTEKLTESKLTQDNIAVLRIYCSDVYNQRPVINNFWQNAQKVYIGQTPLDSFYISLQAYCLAGNQEKSLTRDNSLIIRHGSYESLWTLDYPSRIGNSEKQGDEIIRSMMSKMAGRGMIPARNLLRTWYYLRDIDNNYSGMIKSRLRNYEACGLAAATHSAASTGIEGQMPDPHALVSLHSLSTNGLNERQIVFLKALDHLSPTYDYGVNFERGTKVIFGDRFHCHISGTASIDKYGNVLHKHDVKKQLARTVENMEALLEEGGMSLRDLAAITVYLRDAQDYPAIANLISNIFPPSCAVNITHAPVCRPEWLIEIEGEAIKPAKSGYPDFY